ncbi:MAG TPA: hypothetical protein VLR94_01560 [Acidobacteriota bacterium]|nr:hypothetical protein [Acidobacteriota bacterium]
MAVLKSGTERALTTEQQIELLKAELHEQREANRVLQQQYQTLKTQNDRLLRKEVEHQHARTNLLQKRIVMSRAVVLVPENLVIGDRLENCTIKVYRGTNVLVADTAELINCRIIGLETYPDGKLHPTTRHTGTIEIKGVFYNMTPRKFAISTMERVLISPGARVVGNICADRIVITELTRVKGRLATRDLLMERRARKEMAGSKGRKEQSSLQTVENENETAGAAELQQNEKLDEVIT